MLNMTNATANDAGLSALDLSLIITGGIALLAYGTIACAAARQAISSGKWNPCGLFKASLQPSENRSNDDTVDISAFLP